MAITLGRPINEIIHSKMRLQIHVYLSIPVILKAKVVKGFHAKYRGPKVAHQSNMAPIESQGL